MLTDSLRMRKEKKKKRKHYAVRRFYKEQLEV